MLAEDPSAFGLIYILKFSCNFTYFIVQVSKNTSSNCGNTTIDPSEEMPVNLYHRQFPVRLAFVMTINKSQGQSIINVGIDLRSPVFSHGQLYVALSCCTSSNRIKVVFPEDSNTTNTSNIVYKEVLSGLPNIHTT
jgi:hypothetical protein